MSDDVLERIATALERLADAAEAGERATTPNISCEKLIGCQEQLPSGSWRVRVERCGKKVSKTFETEEAATDFRRRMTEIKERRAKLIHSEDGDVSLSTIKIIEGLRETSKGSKESDWELLRRARRLATDRDEIDSLDSAAEEIDSVRAPDHLDGLNIGAFGGTYVAQVDNGIVKIGHSTSFSSRLGQFQASKVQDVRLLAWFRGYAETERALHAKFDEYNIRNELFRLEGRLLDEVLLRRMIIFRLGDKA